MTQSGFMDFLFDPAPLRGAVRAQARRCLLDLIGVGWGATGTRLAGIICDHAAAEFGGPVPMLFDGRGASRSGVALAGGMVIDALDGHDGFNPAKGHAGCGVLPGLVALAPAGCSGAAFLDALARGYEVACRGAVALHGTARDYHTSGAWVAVAVAAAGARLRGLSPELAREAMGIAEYHGPRSQMMRCIDHPTMLKDGSGWGAMAGVSAVLLAEAGFTGAPAITVEGADVAEIWADLGQRWMIHEQYFKPYPVCRWAQPPVEAALALRAAHGLCGADVARVHVETFHESTRLATNDCTTTEQAQYSTSFPVAVALARGGVTPGDVAEAALADPEVRRLAQVLEMVEHPEANAVFPLRRLARVTLHLVDGRAVTSGWHEPRWDHSAPPSDAELRAKFDALAVPVIGAARAGVIAECVAGIEGRGLADLVDLICVAP